MRTWLKGFWHWIDDAPLSYIIAYACLLGAGEGLIEAVQQALRR